ncbi:MAG: hypothetical protein HYY16_14830 [Planctomycetes bacterium]|nr:hypothetical protein [Planctomycetota bacterium]
MKDAKAEFKDLPYVRLEGDRMIIEADKLPSLKDLIREEFVPVKVRHREDEFLHILQPLEEAIIGAYRRMRELTDSAVRRSLKEVIERFPDPPVDPLAREIHARLHMVAALNPRKMSDAQILACLNRIVDSIKAHEGKGGYLPFLDRMMPG